jgi:hypothetical protein
LLLSVTFGPVAPHFAYRAGKRREVWRDLGTFRGVLAAAVVLFRRPVGRRATP